MSGSGERSGGGTEDTVPASEPPTDIEGRPMRSSIPPFQQRYRMGAELGRGGMGRVVEAFDTQLGRTVALKEVLPKGPGVARRFMREIQITARLEHPAIVPLYDSGTTADGRPFYVMRRVSGRPLDELIKRAPNLGERLVLLPAVLAAIDAVAHAHRRGVIHRDLKPANILVGELGETVVIDWGLAKVVGEDEDGAGAAGNAAVIPTAADSLQTQIGSVFGTPGFMAPEQARGEELGTQGDVYALGATLYQLLAGAPPHSGTSATEVLGKTLKHDVEPLADKAPGAPPELVAIVEKALSFEPETRYANAGLLGEDVRRFLAGQLVAAHRYTRRQRVARYAKRHRAALTIGALAAVVLAVLAWVSVTRVMTERDHANDAQRAAEIDKQAAERARDRLAERNATLIVTQARALLETNPTMALATLKQLDPASPRLADAKAVAEAAVMRGAWWAIRSTDETSSGAELSTDGKLLMQLSRDGLGAMVRIWDLDRKRLVLSRPYGRTYRALWLAGAKLLAYSDQGPPEIIDATTGQVTPAALPPVLDADPDATGTHVLVRDTDKHAALFDAATRTLTPLWDGRTVKDIAIAPDASWLVLYDGKELAILDAAGKLLGTRTGNATRIVVSDHRQVAVLDGQRVWVATIAAPIAFTEVETKRNPNEMIIDLRYRGDELDMYVSSGDVLAYRKVVWTNRTGVQRFTYGLVEAGDHVLIVPSMDGKLYLIGDRFQMAMPLPVSVPNLRIAARPGISRFAVVGVGMVLALDLDTVSPRGIPVELGSEVTFADDDTLLVWRTTSDEWIWIDLRTNKRSAFTYDIHGLPSVIDTDAAAGRVLVREDMGPETRIATLGRGDSKQRGIATGNPEMWGRLIAGNAIVFGSGDDGRVFAKVGDAEPHEAVKLDGIALAACSLGPLMFAAVSDHGEVVRGNLANGAIERINIPPGNTVFIGADLLGRVLIAVDNRLLAWGERDKVIELQKYDQNIERLDATEMGVMVTLADHELQLLDPTGKVPPRRLFTPSTRPPVTQPSGRLVLGTGTGEQLLVLEIPSLARWSVPLIFAGDERIAVAPNARRVAQSAINRLMVWDLPVAGADFLAWLDEQTNATVRDDLLVWPWQQTTASKP